jgi:hypothetical protein
MTKTRERAPELRREQKAGEAHSARAEGTADTFYPARAMDRKCRTVTGNKDPGRVGTAASAPLAMLEGKMNAQRLVAAKGKS